MVVTEIGHVYINDFIEFDHPDIGLTIGKITNLYQKVSIFSTLYLFNIYRKMKREH